MAPTAGRVITCKAAVCWAAKEPLVIEAVEVDPPMHGEVRIQVMFSTLCHSDLTYWQDKRNLGIFPRIFGHEASGIVESIGEGVIDFQEGDHVIPVFQGECTQCRHCMSPKSNMCEKFSANVERGVMLSNKKSRFSINGKPIYFFLGSTFSEFTVVDSANVVKINPAAPLEKVCLLSCGVTTGLASVWNIAKVESGSTVAIFGLGTVGLAVAEGARFSGASRIIGVDTNPNKFDRARTFGITDLLNPNDFSEPVEEVIKNMSDDGVDYSFECVGNSKVIEAALLSCHAGGGLSVICGVVGERVPIVVYPSEFLCGRTLTGALFGGVKPKSQLSEFVEMYMKKEIELDKFITHELHFSQINDAFNLMLEGNGLRCIMHYQ